MNKQSNLTIIYGANEILQYIISSINKAQSIDVIANNESLITATLGYRWWIVGAISLKDILQARNQQSIINMRNDGDKYNFDKSKSNDTSMLNATYHYFQQYYYESLLTQEINDDILKSLNQSNPLEKFIFHIINDTKNLRKNKIEALKKEIDTIFIESNDKKRKTEELKRLQTMSIINALNLLQWDNDTNQANKNQTTIKSLLDMFMIDLQSAINNLPNDIVLDNTKQTTIREINKAHKEMIDYFQDIQKNEKQEEAKQIVRECIYGILISISIRLAFDIGSIQAIYTKLKDLSKGLNEYNIGKYYLPFAIPIVEAFGEYIAYAISLCMPKLEGILLIIDDTFIYFNPIILHSNLSTQANLQYAIKGNIAFLHNNKQDSISFIESFSNTIVGKERFIQYRNFLAHSDSMRDFHTNPKRLSGITKFREVYANNATACLNLCYMEYPYFTSETMINMIKHNKNETTKLSINYLIITNAPIKINAGISRHITQTLLNTQINNLTKDQKHKGDDILTQKHNPTLDYSEYRLDTTKSKTDIFVLQLSPFNIIKKSELKNLPNANLNKEYINTFFKHSGDIRAITNDKRNDIVAMIDSIIKTIKKRYIKRQNMEKNTIDITHTMTIINILHYLQSLGFAIKFKKKKIYISAKDKKLKFTSKQLIKDNKVQADIIIYASKEEEDNFNKTNTTNTQAFSLQALLKSKSNANTQAQLSAIIEKCDNLCKNLSLNTSKADIDNALKALFYYTNCILEDEIQAFWNDEYFVKFTKSFMGEAMLTKNDLEDIAENIIWHFASLFAENHNWKSLNLLEKADLIIGPFFGDLFEKIWEFILGFKSNSKADNTKGYINFIAECIDRLIDMLWVTQYDKLQNKYHKLIKSLDDIYDAPYAVKRPIKINNKDDELIFYPMMIQSNFMSFNCSKVLFGGSLQTGGFEFSPYMLFVWDNKEAKDFIIKRLLAFIIIDEKRDVKSIDDVELDIAKQKSDKDFFRNIDKLSLDNISKYKIVESEDENSLYRSFKKLEEEGNKSAIDAYNKAIDILENINMCQNNSDFKNEKSQNSPKQHALIRESQARELLECLEIIGQNNIKAIYVGILDENANKTKRPKLIGRLATTIIMDDGYFVG